MKVKKSLNKLNRSKKIKQKGRGATTSKSKNTKTRLCKKKKLEKFVQENPETASALRKLFS